MRQFKTEKQLIDENAAWLDSVRLHFNVPTREAWSELPDKDKYRMMGEYMAITDRLH